MNAAARNTVPAEHADHARLLEIAVEAAAIGIWEWDLLTGKMHYSDRAKAIYGFAPDDEVTREGIRERTHPDDLPDMSDLERRSLDPEIRDRSPYEYRIVLPGGRERWILAYGEVLFESAGHDRPTRYIGTIQDITARKHIESECRDATLRLKLAIDAGKMAIWEYDVAADSLAVSPELKSVLGFPLSADVTLDDIRAHYAPGERDRMRSAALAALARGENEFEFEFRFHPPDGSRRWLLLRTAVRFWPDGSPKGVLGLLMDISERKRQEEHTEFLLHELSHRTKNMLAVIQAMIGLSVRQSADLNAFESAMLSRINALSAAHNVMWKGAWRGAEIHMLVEAQLAPFVAAGSERLRVAGPTLWMRSEVAQTLSIALHELATNASKYGALSNLTGGVDIHWYVDAAGPETQRVIFQWQENGGPPVLVPTRKGFGTRILEGLAAQAPGGSSALRFEPTGLSWTFCFDQKKDA